MRALVAAVAALGALAVSASVGAANGYCSPSGDFCTSTQRQNGAVFLQLGTFSFQGKIRILR